MLPSEAHWQLLLVLGAVHLAALASPGPDFALVIKRSIGDGRQAALMTALGLAAGITLHVTWAFFGLGIVVNQAPGLIAAVKIAGALYLAYLGAKCLMAKPIAPESASRPVTRVSSLSLASAFGSGLLTNILNPKALIYFVSLATQFVGAEFPTQIRVLAGLEVVLLGVGWFSLVAILFSRPTFEARLKRCSHWIDRAAGVLFLGFAATMAFAA